MPSSSDAGGVDDRAQGVLGGDRGEELLAAASRSETSQAAIVDLGAELLELCLQLRGALGLGAAAADQEQVAGAVALGQVAGDEGAEAAGGRR